MNIRGLGYAGFGAPDPQQWLEYGTEIIGLMPARALPGEDWGMPAMPGSGPKSGGSGVADDGSVYFKMDDWQWRIAIHPHEENAGILYLGFELGSQDELDAAIVELSSKGVSIEMGSAELAKSRGVMGVAVTEDPSGNRIELFYGMTLDKNFCSPQGSEFITGNLGLGHVNLFVAELDKSKEFYTALLGFKLSDFIRFGPDLSANFYHCNPRHHTLGITHVGNFDAIHHLMFQVKDIDQVGKALHRAEDAGIKITSTLGRHVNDDVLSFYMSSPFGFEVEVGCDGVLVDENWTPSEFVEGDVWGHRGLDPETIIETAEQIKS